MTLICQQFSAFLNYSIKKSSSIFDTNPSHFLLSLPITCFKKKLPIFNNPNQFVTYYIGPYSSSFIIFFKRIEAIFLAVCQLLEVAKKNKFHKSTNELFFGKKR